MNEQWHLPDMTLLDHFAGLAMQALISSQEDVQKASDDLKMPPSELIARAAFHQAAAMLAEKARRENNND